MLERNLDELLVHPDVRGIADAQSVWRRIIGETRHMPTSSQRFQMAFWRDLEVATGLAARPTMSSAVSSSRIFR
jgi:hypothetical protein